MKKKLPFLVAFLSLFIFLGAMIFSHSSPNIPSCQTRKQRQADQLVTSLLAHGFANFRGPFFRWDNQAVIYLSGGEKVIFLLNQPEKEVKTLQLILQKVKMGTRRPKLIDLSLPNPHVTFENY